MVVGAEMVMMQMVVTEREQEIGGGQRPWFGSSRVAWGER